MAPAEAWLRVRRSETRCWTCSVKDVLSPSAIPTLNVFGPISPLVFADEAYLDVSRAMLQSP
jgi:hypothetical protein